MRTRKSRQKSCLNTKCYNSSISLFKTEPQCLSAPRPHIFVDFHGKEQVVCAMYSLETEADAISKATDFISVPQCKFGTTTTE